MEETDKFNLNIRSFQYKSKMDPFECFTFKEAIDHETGFTRSHPQGYHTLIHNIQMVGNLMYNYKLELKRVTGQTDKFTDPIQGGKASLKFEMLCYAE